MRNALIRAGMALLPALALAGTTVHARVANPAPPHLFAESWIAGTHGAEPIMQVQALDADTFVIRQSVKTNFEAPFLYLLFGRDRALLVDTGAGGLAVRPTIDGLIARWLATHGRSSIPLVVAHSHAHGDHIAGDAEFRSRPDTTVLGLTPADLATFFGAPRWPDQLPRFDLGGRVLTIIPTPGHEAAHMMVYDPRLQVVLSGDALYPGRLYVPQNFIGAAQASADRLARFAASHKIRALLGAHIEMTQVAGKDYAHEAPAHPDEHPLELGPETIGQLQSALHALRPGADKPLVRGQFIVVPVPPRAH